VLGIADRRILSDLTAALLEGNSQRALLLVEDLFHFGIDLQKFAGELVKHLRDLIVIKVCAEPGRLVDLPDAEVEQMADLIRDQPPARLHRLFSAMMQGADEIGRSPFPKLALEMVLLRLCEQGTTLPLGEVLQGLARLEARLAGGGGDDGGGFPTPGGPGPSPGGRFPTSAPPTVPVAGPGPASAPTGPRAEAPVPAPAPPPRPLSTLGVAAALLVQGDAAVEAEPMGAVPAEVASSPPPGPEHAPPPTFEPAFTAPDARPDAPACADPEQASSGAGCVGGAGTSVAPPTERFEDDAPLSGPPTSEGATPIDLFDGAPPSSHFETWVANIRKVDSFLGAELELGARLLAFDDEKVVLALPENTHGEVLPATPLLEQILRRSTGRSPRLELLRCPERDENLTGETIYARRQRLQNEHREARIQAARRDPAVMMAVDVLGAAIERVVAR
jgi:hypothetical protein